MKRDIKLIVLKSRWMDFYSYFFKIKFKIFKNLYFKMQKSNFVNPSLIDIHAITQNVQLQYTRNSLRKPIPNKYSRN